MVPDWPAAAHGPPLYTPSCASAREVLNKRLARISNRTAPSGRVWTCQSNF
jgi:hypothetical protein